MQSRPLSRISTRTATGVQRVSQAIARAKGHGSRPGPVHINVAFREPTVPVSDDGRTWAEPYRHPIEGRAGDEPWQQHQQVRPAGAALELGGRGLVVVGEGDFDPRMSSRPLEDSVGRCSLRPLPGLRVFDVVTTYHHLLVTGVPTGLQPDLVVTVGRTGPSDRVGSLTSLPVPQVQVDRWGAWNDPRRHSSHLLQADPAQTLVGFSPAPDDRLFRSWLEADVAMRSALDDHLAADQTPSGPAVARALEPLDEVTLIAASSMPIRDVDAQSPKRPGSSPTAVPRESMALFRRRWAPPRRRQARWRSQVTSRFSTTQPVSSLTTSAMWCSWSWTTVGVVCSTCFHRRSTPLPSSVCSSPPITST